MRYTIRAARYANPEGSLVEVQTEEEGAVMTMRQRQESWQALQEWLARGGAIASHTEVTKERRRDLAAKLDKLKSALVSRSLVTAEDV
jgi:hypothetical protein